MIGSILEHACRRAHCAPISECARPSRGGEQFWQINQGGKPLAYFYLDPYSRPAEKRDGAWMDDVVRAATRALHWTARARCTSAGRPAALR